MEMVSQFLKTTNEVNIMDSAASQDSGYASQDLSSQRSFSPISNPRSPSADSLLTEPASQTLMGSLPSSQPPLSDQDITDLYPSPLSLRSPPIAYPDHSGRTDFFIQIENIVRSFPRDSFFLKWIRHEREWYAHVIFTNKDHRREILNIIESHFEIAPAVDAYLVTNRGVAICPVSDDGTEVSRYLDTAGR